MFLLIRKNTFHWTTRDSNSTWRHVGKFFMLPFFLLLHFSQEILSCDLAKVVKRLMIVVFAVSEVITKLTFMFLITQDSPPKSESSLNWSELFSFPPFFWENSITQRSVETINKSNRWWSTRTRGVFSPLPNIALENPRVCWVNDTV